MNLIHDDWRTQGFVFSESKRIAVSVLVISYSLLFLSGLIVFINLRKKNYIDGRQVKMTLIQSLGAFVIGIYQFYGIILFVYSLDYGSRYSICSAQLWALHGAAIFYFAPVVFNCIRAFYVTSMGKEVLRGYAQEESKLFSTFLGRILFSCLNLVYYGKKIKYPEVRKLEFPTWLSNNLRKYQIISRMDDFFFLFSIVLTVIMLCAAGIIQVVGTTHRVGNIVDMNNCVVGKDIYFIYSVILLFVLILTPIALIFVRNVKENYGIVMEATQVGALNFWFISMYVFWIGALYPQYPVVADKFPAQAWLIIMTVSSFIVSVLLPIKKCFGRSNILLYDRENFNQMILTQPEGWEQFEEAIIADFKPHLLIFELHMQELLEQIYNTTVQNNVLADNFVKGQSYIKYAEIIRIYFCLDSPFCLPLSETWLDEIQQKLVSTKITVGIFDETRNYINDYLFVNTYCRILAFRTVKEDSTTGSLFWPSNPDFLLYRYFSRGSKGSKGSNSKTNSKTNSQSPAPSPMKTASESIETPVEPFKFNTKTISSIYSPYAEDVDDAIPSAVTTHGDESLRDDAAEEAKSKRHTVYPMDNLRIASYTTDSLYNRDSIDIPSRAKPREVEQEDYEPLSELRDSLQIAKLPTKSSQGPAATHVMDRKSFTAIDINDNDNRQIDSVIKKYQTDSYATTTSVDNRDSLLTDDASSAYPSGVMSAYYRESTYVTTSITQNEYSSSVSYQPNYNETSPIDPSIDTRNSEIVRGSTLSSGTRPYFVIEEDEEK